ncbi:MAG: hypothetical protein EOO59_09995 [Hymenobacter sp.]|nr:MAG: hypothetical protein EOO59_09995 [Hymenobacter sp.]
MLATLARQARAWRYPIHATPKPAFLSCSHETAAILEPGAVGAARSGPGPAQPAPAARAGQYPGARPALPEDTGPAQQRQGRLAGGGPAPAQRPGS